MAVTKQLKTEAGEDMYPVISLESTMEGGSTTLEDYINNKIDEKIFEDNKKKYYVGKIIMDTKNINPSTYLGFGTWVLWGSGRVPVGVDTSQTEFNTVEKTGGEKTHKLTVNEMPSHQHTASTGARTVAWASGNFVLSYQYQSQNPTATAEAIKNTGGNRPHNNLQPYITCYMWKRTA